MKEFLKRNWLNIILLVCVVVGGLVIWKCFSAQLGVAFAGIFSFIGFGSKGIKRKVKKRAKQKADAVGHHPEPGIDATDRLESRRTRK